MDNFPKDLKMHSIIYKCFKLLGSLILVLLLSACGINKKVVTSPNQSLLWQQHQISLKKVSAFQATGSLAYINQKTRYFGRFYLKQITPEEYQLKLTSPLGTSIFSLSVAPHIAEYTDKDGDKYRDENVESLVHNLTGMDIPLKTMTNWLIGYSNNQYNDKIDNQGRLKETQLAKLNQIWSVSFSKYTASKYHGNSLDLPSVVELNNQTTQIRLTINNWKLY